MNELKFQKITKKKLKESKADMIITNDIGRKYNKDSSYNEIVIIDSKGTTSVPRTKKERLSKIICKNIEKRSGAVPISVLYLDPLFLTQELYTKSQFYSAFDPGP